MNTSFGCLRIARASGICALLVFLCSCSPSPGTNASVSTAALPAANKAPNRSFLGFSLDEPINLPLCPSKTDVVEKTCVRMYAGKVYGIYLKADEIPDFMEGNLIRVEEADAESRPRRMTISTKQDKLTESTLVLLLMEKYSYIEADKFNGRALPQWSWKYDDLRVTFMNYSFKSSLLILTIDDIQKEKQREAIKKIKAEEATRIKNIRQP